MSHSSFAARSFLSSGTSDDSGADLLAKLASETDLPLAVLETALGEERLAALRRYNVLDTDPEAAFDRLTKLASHVFDVPFAMMTLIDEDRQWCKSVTGMSRDDADLDALPLEQAFCVHTIASEGPMVVEDLADDPRFSHNPYVEGDPGVRFYAGAPIVTEDGHRLGTICVLDVEPHRPSEDRIQQLSALSDMAMEALHERQFSVDGEPEISQTILDHLPGIFYIVDSRGHMKRWNARFESVAEYSAEELQDRPVADFFNPDEFEAVESAIHQVFASGAATVEAEFQPKQGEAIPMYFTGVRTWMNGELHLVGMAIDMSEERRHEQELKESERRFRQLTETIDEVFWLRTEDELLYVSPSFEDLLGRPVNELYADVNAYLDWIHPEDQARVKAECKSLVEDREPIRLEYRVVHPDGTVKWLDVEFSPVQRAIDEPRFAGVLRDITERKTAEIALQEERDRLATLFNTLPIPVVKGTSTETSFQVETVNPAFESTFGVEAETIEGEDLHRFIVPDGKEEEALLINRNVPREGSVREEVQRLANGELRDFKLHATARSTKSGTPEIYAIYTDITNLKRYEAQLKEAKEEAEEAARLKAAMLANMSHEVRTPLTSVIGFSEVLEERLTGEDVRFAGMIRESSHRLMRTLDSVLQLSKLDAGAYDLDLHSMNFDDRARGVLEMLRPRAEEGGVTLMLDAGDRPIEGHFDPTAVDRILTNLVGNAIKFTDTGGRVRVRLKHQGDTVRIDVEDNGIGIGDQFLPEVFHAFRQESDGLGRDYEGTGLGLAITARLVEAHGGSIDVESEKGVGTTFSVHLPIHPS